MSKKNNSKELDSDLKLLVKSSFIVFIGVFLSKLFTYFYRIIVARTFGPEVYGLFSLTLMVLGFFLAVSSLGLPKGLVRFIPLYRGRKENEKIKYVFSFTLVILFFVMVFLSALLFLASEIISVNIFHNSDLIIFLKIFAVFAPISIFLGIFQGILRSYEEIFWYSFISNILYSLSQLTLIILFIYFGMKQGAVIFSYNLGTLITLIVAFIVCYKKFPGLFTKVKLRKQEKKKISNELISYSWPIIFLGIVMSLFSWIDSFAIGYFKTATDVGIYNSAITISLLLMVVPSLFIQLFFPLITKEYSLRKNDLINQLTKQVGKWIFVLNFPIAIVMFLFPGAIINLLFGPEFINAATSLRILSVGLLFYSVLTLSENLLSMAGKSKTILMNLGIASFVNVILNFLLVPRYGINGAAFSTMMSYILWSLLSFFIAKRYTSIVPVKRSMFKIALVSLIPAFVLLFLKNFIQVRFISLILLGLLFLLLYVLIIFITGCLDKNDFVIVNAIKHKFLR